MFYICPLVSSMVYLHGIITSAASFELHVAESFWYSKMWYLKIVTAACKLLMDVWFKCI